MLLFTYNDYLDCLENKKIQKAIYIENKRNRIEEMIKKQNEELQSEQDIKIDQIIEKLISSKDEFINFINDFFKIQKWKITKENLKIYSKLNENKSIIYKHKEKEIYFLIKLQKEPNYHILYIILTECIEIINKWKNIKQSNEKAPIIIPIIIYIGRKKWNSKLNKKIKYTNFGDNFINLSYNLINLHEHKPIELINHKSLISNISILKMNIEISTKKEIIKMLKQTTKEMNIYPQIKELEDIYRNYNIIGRSNK